MVKKSILAIAMLAMLATVTFGQQGTYDNGTGQGTTNNGDNGNTGGQMKFDKGWPKTIVVTWTPIEICCIKVNLKIGYFIEIEDCAKKSINMEQVNCISPQTFPCYKGCTTIKVRANFEAQLGLKLYATSPVINGQETPSPSDDKWKAYFTNPQSGITVSPDGTTAVLTALDGNFHAVDVCVEAWDANLFSSTLVGKSVQVGNVCITAIPTATATCP